MKYEVEQKHPVAGFAAVEAKLTEMGATIDRLRRNSISMSIIPFATLPKRTKRYGFDERAGRR